MDWSTELQGRELRNAIDDAHCKLCANPSGERCLAALKDHCNVCIDCIKLAYSIDHIDPVAHFQLLYTVPLFKLILQERVKINHGGLQIAPLSTFIKSQEPFNYDYKYIGTCGGCGKRRVRIVELDFCWNCFDLWRVGRL
jgi:hypothetical protein